MLFDQSIRQLALDPYNSFIVQAPAGSGKTALLVQRFLVLLTIVERIPEEVIAITFTRKAAAEMQQRVLSALQAAQSPAPPLVEPHSYKTWKLARAVLQRNTEYGWDLLNNPNRLRILTIDSFCAILTRQAPLLSGLGISQPITSKAANEYYKSAIRRLLTLLENNTAPYADNLAALLMHLDNRVDLLEDLLVRMLIRREQWLPHLTPYGHYLNTADLKHILEAGLKQIVQEILEDCAKSIPEALYGELCTLLQFSAINLKLPQLAAMFETFPTPNLDQLTQWQFIAAALLTQTGTWRCQVDKRQGFPANNKAEKTIKQRMQLVLKTMHLHEEARTALVALANAPPLCYTESQWKIIEALITILPFLVAQLKVLFKEKGIADFSELAMAADATLGDKEAPTDLTLILDAQIRHILVDEFQDTSMMQFRLLEKLTAGWQPEDGRSLFLVGDPMQSIYRFREAEVGLFLKVQQEGLGNILLQSLVLQSNFRATPEIIQWINTHFSTIFPKKSNISAGAIAFSPSVSNQVSALDSGVFLHVADNPLQLTDQLITIIEQLQKKDKQQDIAILVRSRTHLKTIIPALKQIRFSFNAVEIEPLSNQSVIQDLLVITSALLHLGDRLSWLALLRAPWCGLTCADLHAIANAMPEHTIWDTLWLHFQTPCLHKVSPSGLERLAALTPILKHSLQQRGRQSYRDWVEETWLSLNGPLCLTVPNAQDRAADYFQLLEELENSDQIIDIHTLQTAIEAQYTSQTADPNQPSGLHIMTIHKAKGLEFDTVIIPHLEKINHPDEAQLLLWLDRPQVGATNDLILAPIHAKQHQKEKVYQWLWQIEKTKANYELIRLLYVAITRAKKQVHLMTVLPLASESVELEAKKRVNDSAVTAQTTKGNSFLQLLGSKMFSQLLLNTANTNSPTKIASSADDFLLPQLPLSFFKLPSELTFVKELSASNLRYSVENSISQKIGTVIHQILETIGKEGINAWTLDKIRQSKIAWKTLLRQKGLKEQDLSQAYKDIYQAIYLTVNDQRGRWILSPHLEHQSEYALTTVINGIIKNYKIDRTFIDAHQVRWIIDYKIAKPAPGQSVQVFLGQAFDKYQNQLEEYASLMYQKTNTSCIQLGLYFPAFSGWYSWKFKHNIP